MCQKSHNFKRSMICNPETIAQTLSMPRKRKPSPNTLEGEVSTKAGGPSKVYTIEDAVKMVSLVVKTGPKNCMVSAGFWCHVVR